MCLALYNHQESIYPLATAAVVPNYGLIHLSLMDILLVVTREIKCTVWFNMMLFRERGQM